MAIMPTIVGLLGSGDAVVPGVVGYTNPEQADAAFLTASQVMEPNLTATTKIEIAE